MMEETVRRELQNLCGTVLFDEPLSKYTTIRIGGPADALVYPKTVEEISSLVLFARRGKIPLFVLGAGSNLLVREKGIRGIVVSLTQGFSQVRIEKEEVYAEAGVGIPRLVDLTAEEGLSGLEPLAGIPGNLGGALSMNAGTPDGEIADAVVSVTFLDPGSRNANPLLVTWEKEKIRFGYRESHFPRSSILLSARLKTLRMASELVKGRVQNYRASRVETQPLNLPNVGSVFKNPAGAGSSRPGARTAPLHAAKLIEEAGLKDVRVGAARISPKHGNFIVNEGGARARDVVALIGLVRDKVKEKFGVLLEPEVKIVGEE